MFDPMKNKRIDREGVIEKFGVGPERVIDVQALAGDSVDNVPGAPGIGIKTAALLINEFGDLESLLDRAEEIPQPKRRETLLEKADQIRLSRELVRLRQDVPVKEQLAEFLVHDPDPDALLGFLAQMEFRTLANRLAEVLGAIRQMTGRFGLDVANVFHAGDGNLHPLILYDANNPGELEKAEAFGADILRLCVEAGGVLTGEHGVGVEKRDLMGTMFDATDLAAQERLKCAFDPDSLLNPGKVFPTLHNCAELGRVHVSGGKVRFPDIPRF